LHATFSSSAANEGCSPECDELAIDDNPFDAWEYTWERGDDDGLCIGVVGGPGHPTYLINCFELGTGTVVLDNSGFCERAGVCSAEGYSVAATITVGSDSGNISELVNGEHTYDVTINSGATGKVLTVTDSAGISTTYVF
jgi:hypothetical protein